MATFAYLFRGGKTPRCLDAVDTNDDSTLDISISDGVASLRHLFVGTFDIPAPGPLSCDLDPTPLAASLTTLAMVTTSRIAGSRSAFLTTTP